MRLSFTVSAFLTVFMLSLFSAPAWGHGVDLFARVEGAQIVGKVTFADGIPVKNAPVRAFAPDGSMMEETSTDGEGAFVMPIRYSSRYRLVCDAGEGHRGLYTVPESEIVATSATSVVREASHSPAPGGDAGHVADPIDSAALEALLARQLGPLRDQLHAYEKQVRIRDVFGGIGYVFGLVGLYVLLKRRPPSGNTP